MSEEWRPVYGYEGFYEVSSMGQVRSIDRRFDRADGRPQGRLGRPLSPSAVGPRRSYLSVTLRFGRRRPIHALVCEAFHGPRPDPTFQAAHWNGDSFDNRAENLRWASPAENSADSRRHGTSPLRPGGRAEQNGHARLSWADVDEIRSRWARGESQASLAAAYSIGKTQVHNIVRGKQWREEWRV